MANNYTLMVQAELNPDNISAQIKALSGKHTLVINAAFDKKATDQFNAEIDRISAKAKEVGKISWFSGDDGKLNKAVVQYTDNMNNAVKATLTLGKDGIKVTESLSTNYGQINKELERAAQSAEKFIQKSQGMKSSPQLTNAVNLAQEIKKLSVDPANIDQVRNLTKQFDLAKSAVSGLSSGVRSFGEGLKHAIKQTAEYALSVGLIYGALRQLKEGIQYVTDLNKEMTNIRLVTGYSQGQVADLALTYNDLAQNLGATTLQVAQSSTEWFRQGKTIEETNKLIESSMMLSKLGNVEAAQSTEYLTSIINGFKLEADDTVDVISKLVALDNAFATSTSEIASAMQRSSVSAQQAGVSLEELASMITVVSDVTRRAPESIGEAFKTMFARYQDILAGQVDEDGMGINNVGKALERVGINIRDVDGGFRDFTDILNELYGKWQDIDEIEQSNILKAMAGIRQRETLLVLLENEQKYRKAILETQDAQGLAEERYKIYLESVEAAQNKLTASWERMWQEAIGSGVITGFLNLASAILDVVDNMGGLKGVALAVAAAFVVMNLANIAGGFTMLVATVQQGITALIAMATQAEVTGLAMNSAFGVAGIVVGALVLAIFAVANAIETTEEKLQRLNQEISDSDSRISKLGSNVKNIRKLSDEYENLSKKASLTKDEEERLLDVQNQLKEVVPELSGHYDEYGNFLIDATNDMNGLTDATLAQIDAEKKLRQAKIDELADVQAKSLIDSYKTKITANAAEKNNGHVGRQTFSDSDIAEMNLEWANAMQEARSSFAQMSDDAKATFIKTLQESGNEGAKLLAEEFQNSLTEKEFDKIVYDTLNTPDYEDRIKSVGDKTAELVFESFTSTLEGLISDDDTISSLMEKSITEGLDFSDISKIPEQYLDALTIENGQLKLNVDLIREKQVAEAEMSLQSIQQAYSRGEATLQEVQVIELYLNKLKEQQYTLIGTAQVASGVANQIFMDIANQAALSGNSFVDLQGKALSSVDAIYKFLQSGDAAFNSFVQQAASATGRSVQQVMGAINSMIANVYNNAATAINNLNGAITSGPNYNPYASQSGAATVAPLFTPAPTGYQYPGGLSDYGGGGGGGGSGSSSQSSQDDNKQQKIDDQIEEARKDAIDDLKEQLDLYKDIIDARKEILDTLADERNYQQDIDEQNENILDIQNQLAALQFDTSEEGQARTLELQDQLNKAQQDLEDTQFDHSIEAQKDALDAQYEAFQTQMEDVIKQVEDLDASSVGQFTSQLAQILSQWSQTQVSTRVPLPKYHDGINSGVVGGSSGSSKSNEILAKVMKGELYVTPEQGDNFLKNILPSLASPTSNSLGGMEIGTLMEISVNGSLDRSVLPDINKIADKVVAKINEAMFSRGHNRRADLFATG